MILPDCTCGTKIARFLTDRIYGRALQECPRCGVIPVTPHVADPKATGHRQCLHCGTFVPKRKHQRSDFPYCDKTCSQKAHEARKRVGNQPQQERLCGYCGTAFLVGIKSPRQCCSNVCTMKVVRRTTAGIPLTVFGRAS